MLLWEVQAGFSSASPKLYVEPMHPKTSGAVASLALLKIRSPVSSNTDVRRELFSCSSNQFNFLSPVTSMDVEVWKIIDLIWTVLPFNYLLKLYRLFILPIQLTEPSEPSEHVQNYTLTRTRTIQNL